MKVPAALIHSLKTIKGFNKEAFEKVHESGEQITSIRINGSKLPLSVTPSLDFENIDLCPVPWNTAAYYLSARPSFTADPLFHAGAYYVQEASSMFLAEVLKQSCALTQPLKVLDLCAAPGGKSTLIQSLISEKSLLVSNEVIKTRVTVLMENIAKWGGSNVIVTNNDPKDFQRLPGYFDVIVVDAPCSGSGLFRKDPAAINEWSEQNVEVCCQRQQRILADVLPALKQGGVLIYSTCSFSEVEDEIINDWLIKSNPLSTVSLKLKSEWNIIETESSETGAYGYRFFPDKLKGEGFFIAALKKDQATEPDPLDNKPKENREKLTSHEIDVLRPWIKNPDDFFFLKQTDEVLAIPVHLEKDLTLIRKSLYVKKAGTKMGVIIRGELIPAHELAISVNINATVPTVEVDKETALQYLRKQEIKLTPGVKGWLLIKYRQLPLGWIKALPNRINNYYPKEWRILNK